MGQMSKDLIFSLAIYLANPRFRVPYLLLGALYPPPQVKSAQTLIVILLFFAHVDTHRLVDRYFSNPCTPGIISSSRIPLSRIAQTRRICPVWRVIQATGHILCKPRVHRDLQSPPGAWLNWAGGEQGYFMGKNGFVKVRVTKNY